MNGQKSGWSGWFKILLLLGVEHNGLRWLAIMAFDRMWGFANYLEPFGRLGREPLQPGDGWLMSATAAVLLANVWLIPKLVRPLAPGPTPVGSAIAVAAITVPFGFAMTLLSTVSQLYGSALFCVLPFAMGMAGPILYGRGRYVPLKQSLLIPVYSVTALGLALLAGAVEGIICLAMAAPLAYPLAMLGGAAGHLFLRLRSSPAHAQMMILILVALPPGMVELEHRHAVQPPLFSVSTSIDIAAPPGAVWQATIAPSHLDRPQNLAFRAGIAYPKGAWIEGSGPGATRYCDFSTGRLVEPVLEWREPELLRFSVTHNPQPMQEWTPWANIHPRHLDGFLVSRQGQFRLIPIPGGTRVEATTWYQHGLYPAQYWRWWSDAIIHRVHEVVLAHIRDQATPRAIAPAIRAGAVK